MFNPSGRLRHPLVGALILVALIGLTNWIYTRSLLERDLNQSLQSRTNRAFVLERGSWGEALRSYRGVWPPLYATVLRTASGLGVPIRRFNQILFYLTLGWMLWWLNRWIPGVHWGWPLLFFSLATFNYEGMSQLVPENLFVPLSLFAFSAMTYYGERPSAKALLWLSLVCSAACLTKYIGLFWLLPTGTLCIVVASKHSDLKTRLIYPCVFALISILPVGIWMGYQYQKTGFLTGIERFEPKPEAVKNEDLTTLGANVWFTAKTGILDFLSASHTGDHATMNHPYQPDWALYVFAGLFVWIVLANHKALRGLVRAAWAEAWEAGPVQRQADRLQDQLRIMGLLVVSYGIVLITLWTVGNNDPIYSRFVYPVYPFLILLTVAAYAWLEDRGDFHWVARASVWAFYGLLIFVHVYKTIVLQHVVHTPAWS